jgi:hypothetical protein
MIDDCRTLLQDFEEFKKNSKEIEDFLESEVEGLTQKLLTKESQTKELKNELKDMKNRFSNQSALIMRLHQDIEKLNEKLENESRTKKSLEIENDLLINKNRNLEFRVSEIEHELYLLQEKHIMMQLEIEEETQKKQEKVQDFSHFSVNPAISLNFQVCGIFNRRSLTGQCREFFLSGFEVNKYFHEFDEVIHSSFCDFFRGEMKKNTDFLHVFFGFRSMIRVLHRFFQSNENDWTAYQFSKTGSEYFWKILTQSEIMNLFNLGERMKKVHFLHVLRYKTSNLQIFDLCENDSESFSILQDLVKSANQGSGFNKMVDCLNHTGKVVVNLNSADHEKMMKFVQGANSVVHREKSTQTLSCCCKETTGNMIYLVGKYKKELEILRKKLKNADVQLVNAKELLKDKEKENKVEMLRLKSSISHLQSLLKERFDQDNLVKNADKSFDRCGLNESRTRVKARRVASISIFDLENQNL